jgi:competence protein ComGC
MLFQKKHQKKIQLIWTIVVIVIIASMIMLYLPGLFS